MMIILVGSENAGTGKSALVTNLAVLLSEGKNVVIVDKDKKHTSANWVKARVSNQFNTEDEHGDQNQESSLKLLGGIIEYDDLMQEIEGLNKAYDRVIIDFPAGLSQEFEEALLIADMVIFPFRPLKQDLDTLPAVVEAVKKAKATNPELVVCAVITMCFMKKWNQKKMGIEKLFTDYGDTVRLVQPVLLKNPIYQDALNTGKSVLELNNHENVSKRISSLFSAIRRVYKSCNKQTVAIEPSEIVDDSSEEQRVESVPSAPDNFSSNTDFSAEEFSNGLKDISDDELVERYKDLSLQHVRMDVQFKMMQGLILLEARSRFKSNKEFGQWVVDVGLSDNSYQNRNLYMNFAKFFQSRDMTGISLTAAYEISRPGNKKVAKAVYEIAKDKKLGVEEVKRLISEKKSELRTEPSSPNVTVDKRVKKLLKQVEGLSLNNDERVDFLTQCISEFQQLIDKAQHPTHDDE